MADFPSSLPKALNRTLFEDTVDTSVSDPNDIGIPNRRATTTKEIRTFSFSIRMKNSPHRATLDTFYNTTISKVGNFNWTHPITSEVIDVIFVRKPSYTQYSFDVWDVGVELQEV